MFIDIDNKELKEQIEQTISSLESEIAQVNSLCLMAFINEWVIKSINLIDKHNNLPDGFAQKFHYLYGLVLSKPLVQNGNILSNLATIIKLTNDLFNEYAASFIKQSKNFETKPGNGSQAGAMAFINNLFQPKLGSSEQFKQFLFDQFEPFDKNFFTPKLGFTIRQCVDIASAIIKIIEDKYQASRMESREVAGIDILYKTWQQFNSGRITFAEAKTIGKENPISGEQLIKNRQQVINPFIIKKEELLSEFSIDIVEAFFKAFSFIEGKINKGFRYPTDLNGLDTSFLLELESDRYFITEPTRLFLSLSLTLFQAIIDSEVSNKYFKHRDDFTQKKAVNLLGSIFPKNTIREEAYYGYTKKMEFETDILIPFGRTLIIGEAKSKALRNPLHTKGNLQKVKKDFEVSLQNAYQQAVRAKNYILSKEEATFVDSKQKPLITLKRDDYDQYLLILITAESFGTLATDISILLEKDQDAEYPWAISLFDLELLVTRINTPEKFLHYVSDRCKLYGRVFSSDELDFAGYFIKYNNLDFKQTSRQYGALLDGEFASIFDNDYREKYGMPLQKNINGKQPFIKEIEFYKAREKDMRVLPEDTTVSRIMKGSNRNKPCFCGSGKKWKKCHG